MTSKETFYKYIREVMDFPKKGINFKDFTPLLFNQTVRNQLIDELVNQVKSLEPDVILGVESRGFVLGAVLADRLNLPFVMARKRGKLPGSTHSVTYKLEYGNAELEIHTDQLPEGSRVLIHDDLLATGGTASAVADLVAQSKSSVVGFSFIIELSFLNARSVLEKKHNTSVYSSLVYDS